MVPDMVAAESSLRPLPMDVYNLAVELQIHRLDSGHAIANFGPVLILVITTAETDAALIDELARQTEHTLSSWPMCALWVVVHHGTPIPDGEVRRHTGRALRPFRERQCVVFSLLGLGFWASAAIAACMVFAKLIGQRPLIESSVEAGAERVGLELIGVDAEKLAVVHDELLEAIQTHAKVA
jgi:hypothetical protein